MAGEGFSRGRGGGSAGQREGQEGTWVQEGRGGWIGWEGMVSTRGKRGSVLGWDVPCADRVVLAAAG